VAMKNCADMLLELGYDVHIVSMATYKHPFVKSPLHNAFISKTQLKAVNINTKLSSKEAVKNLLTNNSYVLSRFNSVEFSKKISLLLQSNTYDIVWFESLFTSTYINIVRQHSKAICVYRSHNIEHNLWADKVKAESNFLKIKYLKLQYNRLKKEEETVAKNFDAFVCISPQEVEYFSKLGVDEDRILNLPFSINPSLQVQRKTPTSNFLHLGYIGALDWEPNSEALQWFLQNVWPEIKHLPIQFSIAGKNSLRFGEKLKSDKIEVLGEVESAKAFMQSIDLLIVPLFKASGIRIKVLEAFSVGLAVLASDIAMQGLIDGYKECSLLAQTKEDFVQQIHKLFDDKSQLGEMSKKAITYIENNYAIEKLQQSLQLFLNHLHDGKQG